MSNKNLTDEEREKWIKEHSIVEQKKLGTTKEKDIPLEE